MVEHKPLFARRHYEALAEILCQLSVDQVDQGRIPGRAHLPISPVRRQSKAEYHEQIVTAICNLLQKDNPRFRPDAFRAAVNRRES